MARNTKIQITAIFRGKDGSVGFRKNTEYKLTMVLFDTPAVTIIENDTKNEVGYTSIVPFLKNWSHVTYNQ